MSMKKKIIIGTTLCLTVLGVTFAVPKINKYHEEKARIEAVVQEKEDLYNEYVDFLEGLTDSEDNLIDNAIEVIDVSNSALHSKIGALSRDGFALEDGLKVSEKGNEYLEKLEQIALENLNKYLTDILNDDNSVELYREIDYKIYDDFLNEENKLLVEEVKEELEILEKKEQEENDKRKAEREAEYEAEHGISWNEARVQAEKTLKSRVQTGMSKSEVTTMIGTPKDKFKSSEAEFWNYGDMVLTMKNGYVFDITYSY
ncbi:hypothetical protein AMS59_13675 [Lysinibacillus sp. FJAT-14745]|uniref:hypothetical protein n=1 Tax=Lysinibacillus sp. FJAT-14745 TaxID=1704289 RepID=UPI0006ABA35D|nr:hypothetical protein [Lysinibacillus sp. FJAT-14745]KOP78145.1 hypothetical protein AMS59_13675 [Lysinibacillus sp. FJAT-14745]